MGEGGNACTRGWDCRYIDYNITCTPKPNNKLDSSPLQYNIANSYLVFNPDWCGVTMTTGTLLNHGFPSECFPEGTGGGVYAMGTSGGEGVGMDCCYCIVYHLPLHPSPPVPSLGLAISTIFLYTIPLAVLSSSSGLGLYFTSPYSPIPYGSVSPTLPPWRPPPQLGFRADSSSSNLSCSGYLLPA